MKTRQLSLFSADHEASRRLHEAYDLLLADAKGLAAEVETLRARLAQAKVEFRTLRQERDQAQLDARHWHSLYTMALLLRPQGPPPLPPTLEPTLKKLLALSHPDKWARGQPATELAHELAVAINHVRRQGEALP